MHINQETDENQPPKFKQGSKNALFIKLANPNELGCSRAVSVEKFVGKYQRLQFGNGADFARQDGTLAKYYNICLHKRGSGNKITHVELQGYRKVPVTQKPIPDRFRRIIAAKDCVVLGTGKPECDHKDGRADDPRLSDVTCLSMDDFQPLSKAANDAKRQHCVECRDTGKRFDAKRLGYQVSQVRGNGKYNGTCVGCYWHDPIFFNKEVSRNFSDS